MVKAIVFMRFLSCLFLVSLRAVLGGTPVSVQVSLGGKYYDIAGVTTVKELQEGVKKASGDTKLHKVLFGDKQLDDSDVLTDVGVQEGSQLSMVPSTKIEKASSVDPTKAMEDYMKNAGVDTSKIQEMMKGMGGGGKAPDMKESIEQMTSMMNSPLFQQYMSDPEQLEKSRKMIMDNPMLKGMMSGMPGMDDILNDPVKWREAMTAAANMYKNMDPDQLMKAMGSAAPGAFDGAMGNSAAAKALDELDEDD